MLFEINFNDKHHVYDLGTSAFAEEACKGLGIYNGTGDYGVLRRIFANLNWIISKGNSSNKQACLATHALALKVFQTTLEEYDEYKKFFLADAVTDICTKAGYPILDFWLKIHNGCGQTISKNFNPAKALEAGLAVLDVASGQMNVQPIPEYPEYPESFNELPFSELDNDSLRNLFV